MSAILTDDYVNIVGGRAPLGLVSDPPDYKACVASAERIPLNSERKQRLSPAQLGAKCRQLYAAIKEQALTYLIPALWRTQEAKELGTGVSDAEVTRRLQQVRYSEYPSPAAFARYLAERHWSISDERFEIKRVLLISRYGEKVRQRAAALGGGAQAVAQLVHESFAKWSAKTDCSPGYVALQCKRQHGASATSTPSPAALLIQLSGKVT
jgi:hypothetical protein